MPTNHESLLLRRRKLWLWIVYWLGLFVATHLPLAGHGPPIVRHGDKVFHFVAYLFLAILGGRYLLATGDQKCRGKLVVWAVVFIVYAAFDEWLQQFVGRSASFHDWLADAAGIVAATALLAYKAKKRTEPNDRDS